jgi:hypothetical protein
VDIEDIRSASYVIGISNCGFDGEIAWEASEDACWLSLSPSQGTTSTDSYTELHVETSSLQSGNCLSEGWHATTVTIEATTSGVEDAVQTIEVSIFIGELANVHLPVVTKN